MNETEHLLTVVAEESSEVGQRACKAIRFGLAEIQPGQLEDNKRRLEREIADLLGAAKMLGLTIREDDVTAKIEKLKKFMGYSKELGTLETKIEHCQGAHCFIYGMKQCICLCAKCAEAKKADH